MVQASGDVGDTISAYLRNMASREESGAGIKRLPDGVLASRPRRQWGTGEVRIVSVSFVDADGRERSVFHVGEPFTLRMHYQTAKRIDKPVFGMAIHRMDGVHVCGPNTGFSSLDIPFIDGEGDVLYRVDSLPLMEGTYLVSVAIHNQADTTTYDYHDRLYTLRVRQVGDGERYGLVGIGGRWEQNGNRPP